MLPLCTTPISRVQNKKNPSADVGYRKQGIHYLHGNKLWVNQEVNLVVILSRSATRYYDSQSRENVCEHGGEHASGLHAKFTLHVLLSIT
jgi:hypothetical protein